MSIFVVCLYICIFVSIFVFYIYLYSSLFVSVAGLSGRSLLLNCPDVLVSIYE